MTRKERARAVALGEQWAREYLAAGPPEPVVSAEAFIERTSARTTMPMPIDVFAAASRIALERLGAVAR